MRTGPRCAAVLRTSTVNIRVPPGNYRGSSAKKGFRALSNHRYAKHDSARMNSAFAFFQSFLKYSRLGRQEARLEAVLGARRPSGGRLGRQEAGSVDVADTSRKNTVKCMVVAWKTTLSLEFLRLLLRPAHHFFLFPRRGTKKREGQKTKTLEFLLFCPS